MTTFIVDEAARCTDETYHALRPVLATSGGRIVLLSTPHGRQGFFFREWIEGRGWHRVSITADLCNRIPADWLAQERDSLPPHVFASEYLCQFTDIATAVFGSEFIYAALREDVRPLWETAA